MPVITNLNNNKNAFSLHRKTNFPFHWWFKLGFPSSHEDNLGPKEYQFFDIQSDQTVSLGPQVAWKFATRPYTYLEESPLFPTLTYFLVGLCRALSGCRPWVRHVFCARYNFWINLKRVSTRSSERSLNALRRHAHRLGRGTPLAELPRVHCGFSNRNTELSDAIALYHPNNEVISWRYCAVNDRVAHVWRMLGIEGNSPFSFLHNCMEYLFCNTHMDLDHMD